MSDEFNSDEDGQSVVEESLSQQFIRDDSMHLAGLVQECVDVYLFSTLANAETNSNAVAVSRKRKLNASKRITWSSRCSKRVIDFPSSVVHLKLLLKSWEDSVNSALEKDYLFKVKVLQLSVHLLRFLEKARRSFSEEILRAMEIEGLKKKNCDINAAFITSRHLKLMTSLFCFTLNECRIEPRRKFVPLLLNLFMDAFDTLLNGVLQNVSLDLHVASDWLFLLAIPWLKSLAVHIPCCHCVAGLNLLYKSDICFDQETKFRCIKLLRFEMFYPLRTAVRLIFKEATLDERFSRVALLNLISGFWWPSKLIGWTQKLKFCLFIFSQRTWTHDHDLAVALAETLSRLPCIFTDTRTARTKPDSIHVGCKICDRVEAGQQHSAIKTAKLKQKDVRLLLQMVHSMLLLRNHRVHLNLINLIQSLRKHTKLRLLSYTSVFWNMFCSSDFSIQLKTADVFGYCTKDMKLVKYRPRNNVRDVTVFGDRRKHANNARDFRIVSQKVKDLTVSRADVKRSVAKPTTAKNPYSSPAPPGRSEGGSSSSSVSSKKGKPSTPKQKLRTRTSDTDLDGSISSGGASAANIGKQSGSSTEVCIFTTRKEILTKSKSTFMRGPTEGRFDTADYLHNQILYLFYMTSSNSFKDDIWTSLVDFHNICMTLSRYVDGDVWVAEILKFNLHVLAKLDMVHAIILCQRVFAHLGSRANCQPWELCARYRETFSQEIKMICLDTFFSGSDDEELAIKRCRQYFLKVQIAMDMSSSLMMNTFLRSIVKQCVLEMFEDDRQHALIKTVSEYCNCASVIQFLKIEFAYYYPHILLKCTPAQTKRLLSNIRNAFSFDPEEIMQYNPQFLHIEMMSNIFEYRDRVFDNYTQLLGMENDGTKESKRLIQRAIGDSIEKLYVGIYLYFEARFRSKAESIISKRRYLGCLALLLELLGKKRVTNSKLKIYSTLNTLREMGPDYHDLLYQAWRSFTFSLEDSSLRSLACQICAGVSYLRRTHEVKVDGFWKSIVLTRCGPALGDKIKHLHFLNHSCGDPEVQSKLIEVNDKISALQFYYQLVDEVGNENSHVQYRAVLRLKNLLETKIEAIVDLKFDSHLFTYSTTKLLKNLLQASKQAKTGTMKMLCASCIGIVGALDPRRFDLQVQLSPNAKLGQSIFTVGEQDFLLYFIEEVTRAIRGAADTRDFDACALCIQEIIKLYSIEQSDSNYIWKGLSEKAKDLLLPLFASKYSKSDRNSDVEIPRPIFMTEFGTNLKQWMYSWFKQMVSVVTSERREFFNIVVTAVNKSDQMGMVLLPYITSYALMEGGNLGLEIFIKEVCAVLGHWVYQAKISNDPLLAVLDEAMEDADKIPSARSRATSQQSQTVYHTVDRDSVSEQFAYAATQAVFKVLDHLTRLVRNPRLPSKKRDSGGSEASYSQAIKEKMEASRNHTIEAARPVDKALKKLNYDVMSSSAFACRNYARALMYMEQHLNHKPDDFDNCFGNLQRIYVALFDEDSVKGLETRRQIEPTIMEEALSKLSQGKLEPCVSLLQTIVTENPDDLLSHQQLTYAYLGLNQFSISDLMIDGCCSNKIGWSRSFDEARLEIDLIQDKREELEKRVQELSSEKLNSWGLTVAKALLCFNNNNMEACRSAIKDSSVSLISDICNGAAWLDMGFYYRHYQDLIRLQLLTELEETTKLVMSKVKIPPRARKAAFLKIKQNWDRRIKCAYKSTEILRPIISFRKALLDKTKKYFRDDAGMVSALDTGVRDCYVSLAKLETGLGNYARAHHLFLESKIYSPASVFYEEAKMLFEAGKYNQSLNVLEVGMKQYADKVEQYVSMPAAMEVPPEQVRYAKGALLYAKLMDEQRKVDKTQNIINYEYAIKLNKRSEKNYFYLACYYDRLWSQSDNRDRHSNLLGPMIKNYGESLTCGCNFLYHSLPRLLTMWFDNCTPTASSRNSSSSLQSDPELAHTLTKYIKDLLSTAPTHMFIIAFSQLVSRLTHANITVYNQLKEILALMVAVHPAQVLWMLASVLESKYRNRVDRCNEVLKLAESRNAKLRTTTKNYRAITKLLITFTMKKLDHSRYAKVSEVLPQLSKLIRGKEFSDVLIPFELYMHPVLPRGGKYVQPHRPFPPNLVYIQDIREPVQVMASLQKPKRINFVGTDGRYYGMMCKPSDDLRKDAKVMEINSMVHWYMSRDKEARKRNLIIRTYCVTPLNDTCGILEWIPNLHGYRPLITSLYRDGLGMMNTRNIKGQVCDRKDSLTKKRQIYQEVYVANHPIVMSNWFLKSFQDPQSWHMARTSYVKTAAVMSIIGYLMGLGDRHGENILLDSSSGDVVHVDFNCLFNKGETFDWPERVPFRLTRNMLNGMGPLGYEGMFRCCCEIVMQLVRNHSSVFLSIIRPFLLDPLLEWDNHTTASNRKQSGECNHPKAVEHLHNIRDRLLGSARNMTKTRDVALSVEAHVNYLIKESTKLDNLCQMYIGWAPYL